jgi:hypothetical protein
MEIGQKGCYIRTMTAMIQLQKKSGREPQGVWRQTASRKVTDCFFRSETLLTVEGLHRVTPQKSHFMRSNNCELYRQVCY